MATDSAGLTEYLSHPEEPAARLDSYRRSNQPVASSAASDSAASRRLCSSGSGGVIVRAPSNAEARDGGAVVPGSAVRYVTADVLDPPAEWTGAFALVVESISVQALPERLHAQAIANIARTVAPSGTLLVIAAVREQGEPVDDPPPWPLTRSEIDAFAAGELRTVRVEELRNEEFPRVRFWRAEYGRPAAAG